MEASRRPPTRPGLFVSFEGGEGAGKSTQIALLRDRFRAGGRSVLTTREPGGSDRAEGIRAILLSGQAKHLGSVGEAILFAAARRDHVETLIAPALGRGEIVLCDRFIDSTRVYQGAVAGLDAALLANLDRAAAGETIPDVTVLIDVPVALGLERARARRAARREAVDRFEAEGAAYHERVRRAFLALADAEPGRCIVVDGSGSEEEVARSIWAALAPRVALPEAAGA